MMSNKIYDFLKPVAQYILPALATFYGVLAPIWGLPYAEEITGTIMVLDVLLGAILGMSKIQYTNELKKSRGYAFATQPNLPDVDPNMPKWYIPQNIYDILYSVAQVWLPALGAAYFGLAGIWKLPYGESVVATIAAVDTLLGVVLAVSTYELNKAMSAVKSKLIG